MGLLLHGGINGSLFGMALLAVAAIALMLVILHLWSSGNAALSQPDLQMGSCIGNTAYFGIPATLALLPPEALPVSIGYDLGAVSYTHLTLPTKVEV